MVKKRILEWIDEKIFLFLNKNVRIMPARFCKYIAYYYTDARVRKKYWRRLNVYIGQGSFPSLGMVVVNSEKTMVKIGKNVSIGPGVSFIAESMANNGIEINQFSYVCDKITKYKMIVVEDDVWIGANVMILPGLRIGRCSVIGAGSIVTKDVEPYSVYMGSPARKIRTIKEGD